MVSATLGDTTRKASTRVDAADGTGVTSGDAKARALWLEELHFSEDVKNTDGDEEGAVRFLVGRVTPGPDEGPQIGARVLVLGLDLRTGADEQGHDAA